jgi:hypothetical protein
MFTMLAFRVWSVPCSLYAASAVAAMVSIAGPSSSASAQKSYGRHTTDVNMRNGAGRAASAFATGTATGGDTGLRDVPIAGTAPVVPLDGVWAWTVSSKSLGVSVPATVPGDLLSDLQRNKVSSQAPTHPQFHTCIPRSGVKQQQGTRATPSRVLLPRTMHFSLCTFLHVRSYTQLRLVAR